MPSDPARESLVLDSSVLVKWYLEEPDSNEALEILNKAIDGEIAVLVPDLAFYEVANALISSRLYSADQINRYLEALAALGLTISDFDLNCLHVAVETSMECKLAIYDSYFVALADLEDLRLVTADEEAAKKTRGISHVVTLAEYIRSERK
ncbi:MAG: type II toxin-antitoxin system VapC family toxin [Actinomycetota bacterium]